MDKMLISPVKREKMKKLQQQKRKIEMRAALPVLTRDEIRRYRLPLHEALLAELEENNYVSSKAYLEQLINYQKTMKEREGPNSIIWLWPDLINQRDYLKDIYNTLKIAEKAHAENNIKKEFDELLRLGVCYAFGNKIWWWLGEQFLILCIDIIKQCKTDGHKREALISYIYGRFLTLNKKENEKAIPHLVKARSLSKVMSWRVKLIKFDRKDQSLYIEACQLLFKISFQQAMETQLHNPIKAIEIYELAKEYASNTCDRSLEADGLLYQGICYLVAAVPRNATIMLLKSLLLNEKLKRHEEVCKARINLALAYITVDNFDEAIAHLEALKRYAEEKNLPYYIGQNYRYLGEYYINHGEAQLAIPILEKAVLIFHSLNAAYERLQVNNFCAIARGQVLLRNYIHLIIRSGYPKNRHYLLKLINWKDSREKFCEEEEYETEDRGDSIESTLAVYEIQHDEVSEIKKGMSRIFLSSIQLSKFDRCDDDLSQSSVSTALSKSLSSFSSKDTVTESQKSTEDDKICTDEIEKQYAEETEVESVVVEFYDEAEKSVNETENITEETEKESIEELDKFKKEELDEEINMKEVPNEYTNVEDKLLETVLADNSAEEKVGNGTEEVSNG